MAAERPLIGVTTSEFTLGVPYLHAIEAAGGLPVVVAPLRLDSIQPLLDQLAGICLSGGPDISPKVYGADESPHLGPTHPALDGFEIAMARMADVANMPILAIGRGMQALNVVRGGSLHQHLPEISSTIEHSQDEPGDKPTHAIEIQDGSLLSESLGTTKLDVNSFHHQGVNQLGDGMSAVATAPDDTVEAIEAADRDFIVGVQWNAELLARREPEAALFKRFVEACLVPASRSASASAR